MSDAQKPEAPTFQSWDEADGAGQEILTLAGQLEAAQAAMDEEVAEVKERHKGGVQELALQQKLLLKGVEDFVEAHRTELAGKSRTLTHVVVGYRTSPPSVAARLKGGFKKVLERILGLGNKAEPYIRTKRDLNKDAILEAWKAGHLTAPELVELGVKIEQKETFYCEPIQAAVAQVDPAA